MGFFGKQILSFWRKTRITFLRGNKVYVFFFAGKRDFTFLAENHGIMFLTGKTRKKIQFMFLVKNMILRFCGKTDFTFLTEKRKFYVFGKKTEFLSFDKKKMKFYFFGG